MSELRCRVVDRRDTPAIHRQLAIAHAANASSEPFAVYAARRLHRIRRRSAQWWLGEVDGQARSSLICYPLELESPDGTLVPGYGLGAVATLPEAQGAGYASRLCRRVAEAAEADGRRVGMLFSAIPAAFYERLGYRVCPAFQHVCDDPGEVAASGPHARLSACDPLLEPGPLIAAYQATLAGRWRMARREASWRTSWDNHPEDLCFRIDDGAGYVRVYDEPTEMEIVELCPPPGAPPQPALRALAALALAMGRTRLTTWLPPEQLAGSSFRDQGRAATLPMLRGVSEAEVQRARFVSADYF